ncbi:c-type cytochrome [Gelidibacter japonicus]|uniref:c-type cytochrome n=1 Tax=Gelidibacter japonicus TaxID=1962232 RepID=UPI0013D6800A|nr:cytochrome c [Gelidibacter japonicus]
MKKRIFFVVFVGSLLVSCGSNTFSELEDDFTPDEFVTYNSHVKDLIQRNCISCHAPGGISAFRPLTNYTLVKEAVLTTDLLDRIQRQNGEPGAMPQTGRMAQNQIDIVLQWVEDGLLEF